MSRESSTVGTPRTDQQFVAEAMTETGVLLTGVSEWQPSHWDQQRLRVQAESDLRKQFKQTESLNVKVGPIRIYRVTRRSETVSVTWTSRKLYAEVTR